MVTPERASSEAPVDKIAQLAASRPGLALAVTFAAVIVPAAVSGLFGFLVAAAIVRPRGVDFDLPGWLRFTHFAGVGLFALALSVVGWRMLCRARQPAGEALVRVVFAALLVTGFLCLLIRMAVPS